MTHRVPSPAPPDPCSLQRVAHGGVQGVGVPGAEGAPALPPRWQGPPQRGHYVHWATGDASRRRASRGQRREPPGTGHRSLRPFALLSNGGRNGSVSQRHQEAPSLVSRLPFLTEWGPWGGCGLCREPCEGLQVGRGDQAAGARIGEGPQVLAGGTRGWCPGVSRRAPVPCTG